MKLKINVSHFIRRPERERDRITGDIKTGDRQESTMKQNSQHQARHYQPRGGYNNPMIHHVAPHVQPMQQPPQPPPPQQPHLYSRSNHQYLSQPVDMPPPETVVARLETACRLLHGIGMNNTRVAEISSEIQILSEDLRRVGPHLELAYPDVLDRVMSSMRDASAQPCLPPHLRLAIFELVELRASKWLLPSDSSNYYRQRRTGHEEDEGPELLVQSHPKVAPPGGTTVAQDKPDSKTYREEILIKNSDSGKVSATAKERVLSINGYSQQSINLAKSLIHETINRNSSPVFDTSASAMMDKKIGPGGVSESDSEPGVTLSTGGGDANGSGCQFNYTVAINDEVIKVSGNNFQLVQEAKLALDDYFSCKYNLYPEIDLEEMESSVNNGIVEDTSTENTADMKKITSYTRDDLYSIGIQITSNVKPNFSHLDQTIQDNIVLKTPKRVEPSQGKK
ncbi:unnamed protein product [Allacma fusca]|uniref:Uncharacterized protein n=1 Tax=Allacma fusca TaxID=39272 RepID=A0A8J2NJI2_9HEXA|nr:unnamed protein product [Allacma fusca]